MKKQLIATSLILSLATAPAMATSTFSEQETSDDNTSEIIGFSSGAIIGGLIAGPIGIVVAGTVGAILGQSQDRKEQVELAEVRLEKNTLAMQLLSNDKSNLEERLTKSEQKHYLLTQALALTEKTLSDADKLEQLKLNLQFDINSSQVESFYTPQIKHLAMMMQENPELSVNLSGYSDSSGSEKSNLTLSQARIESVKLMLVNLGVDEQFINTEAFGESNAMQAKRTENSDFNERRVDVTLFSPEHMMVLEQVVAPEPQSIEEKISVVNQESTEEKPFAQTQILADVN